MYCNPSQKKYRFNLQNILSFTMSAYFVKRDQESSYSNEQERVTIATQYINFFCLEKKINA
jgi:hypothetical protein